MHFIYTTLNLFLLWSNAYSSYKTLQLPKAGPRGGQSSRLSQNRKRDMKTCLAIWVVWVSWWSCERLGDHTVGIVMPFYHEVKCVILIILLLTRTWGAEPIVLHVIRPTIKPYIPLIDTILHWAHEAGDFVWLLACLPYDIAHDWWYGSKSAPPYEEHHHDTRVLVKPDPLLPPEKESEPAPPKHQPSPTDAKPPAYTYPVDPSTADVPPIPSKTQMINAVQQANEVYREISNAQQQVREQASTIGTRARKRSQANTTSNVPQAGPSAPNIVQFNPTKVTLNANMRPKAQVVQVQAQAPGIIKRHAGDLPLNLPLSKPQPQHRMSDPITVRGQDSWPILNTHVHRNIPAAPQQPRTEGSPMPFPQPQPAPPPSLYPTIPVFETPRLPGHLALSPLFPQPPPLPVLVDVPPIPPPRPPGLLPLNLPVTMPEPQPFRPATQSQTQSQASQRLPKPALPLPTPVLHQPQAQRMTHFPNAHAIPARPSAPPPVATRRGSSNSVQGVAPPATRRGSAASQTSRRSTQDAVKEKEKLIVAAATVEVTEEGFGLALPRPRGRSAAVVVSNTRKTEPLPVVLPAVSAQVASAAAGANKDRYGGRPTAPGSAGNRRGVLGARRGGRGLKTKAHTEQEVRMTGREEVRADLLDRPISGSDMERADSTRSRRKIKLDIRGSQEAGEEEAKQVQGVEARVKRLRSPIRALGQIGKGKAKVFVEGKDGKAPEKPEIVAGKKRSFQHTKTGGRSTFSAITSSEEEGTEDENDGSARKKLRLAPAVNVGGEEDVDEDETEDELATPKRLFKRVSSPPNHKQSSIFLGTKHDPDVEGTIIPRPLSPKPIRAAEPPKIALPRITRSRKGGN